MMNSQMHRGMHGENNMSPDPDGGDINNNMVFFALKKNKPTLNLRMGVFPQGPQTLSDSICPNFDSLWLG